MTGPDIGPDPTAGEALLMRLGQLGVDVILTNSGTDFPPLIEGLAATRDRAGDRAGGSAADPAVPRLLLVGHEHVAMGMAHGYYLASGRPQAVMLHTNVGLANGATGAINAATDQVPMVLLSGRTPTVEAGRFGARTVPIGWGQEMRDQTALVREACKWDYELRFPEQVPDLLDRAVAIADTIPRGPAYLSLPREVLCQPCPAAELERPPAAQPAGVGPVSTDLAAAAELLATAERPLIIAQRGAGSSEGFDALARLADEWAIPVCQYWAVATAISSRHPLNVGSEPRPWLAEADVVLVIDSLAPWSPGSHPVADGCRVIELGPDPLHSRVPVRGFRADIALTTETGPGIVALAAQLDRLRAATDPSAAQRAAQRVTLRAADAERDQRRDRITALSRERRRALEAAALDGSGRAMTKAYVAHCVGRAIAGHRATVLSELGCPLDHLDLSSHDSYRQEPHSGGLGWSLPCAMGMKLADPERLVVATMGDGSYLFANPVACHQVAEAVGIPVLTVIVNNGGYGAVRRSVAELYPTGHAAKADEMPLTSLSPSPDFALVAAASRAHSETVDDGADLPAALERAIRVVSDEGRQALLDVRVVD